MDVAAGLEHDQDSATKEGKVELLIEAVRQIPALWDKRSARYSAKRDDKKVLWQRVASASGTHMTWEEAKTAYTRAKTYFVQRLRMHAPSGSPADEDFDKLGPYAEQLRFLIPVVRRGKNVSSAQFNNNQQVAPRAGPSTESQIPADPESSLIFEGVDDFLSQVTQFTDGDIRSPVTVELARATALVPSVTEVLVQEPTPVPAAPVPASAPAPAAPAPTSMLSAAAPIPAPAAASAAPAPTPVFTAATTPAPSPAPERRRRRGGGDPVGERIMAELANVREENISRNRAFGSFVTAELDAHDEVTAKRMRIAIFEILQG